MSTSVVKRSPDSPESLDSNKPKQASRSVSLLTPEQLQRKRAQDRESQRQTRYVLGCIGPRDESDRAQSTGKADNCRLGEARRALESRITSYETGKCVTPRKKSACTAGHHPFDGPSTVCPGSGGLSGRNSCNYGCRGETKYTATSTVYGDGLAVFGFYGRGRSDLFWYFVSVL